MAEYSKSKIKQGSTPANGYCGPCPGMAQGAQYSPPNLVATSPQQQQFEPTAASPLHQRQRMSGVG